VTARAGEVLERARQQADLPVEQLWVQCQGIGSHVSPDGLEAILAGTVAPTSEQHDEIAQALNDTFVDLGLDHPVPYSDDV
jgi:hypothetical protein